MVEKPTVLVLHGYAQNASIFSKRLGALRKEAKDVELVFIDAPIVLRPVDLAMDHAVFSPEIPFDEEANQPEQDPALQPRAWWRPSSGRTRGVGLEGSIAAVRDLLKERRFDGVLGFSQGAAFAAIISALLEKPDSYPPFLVDGKPPHPPFKFCIAVSGFRLIDPICDPLFTPSYSTPTLHILGKNDVVVIEERTRKLIEVSSNKRIVKHDGGHFVPSRNDWRKFLAEFLRNPFSDIPSPGLSSVSAPPSGTATPTTTASATEPNLFAPSAT